MLTDRSIIHPDMVGSYGRQIDLDRRETQTPVQELLQEGQNVPHRRLKRENPFRPDRTPTLKHVPSSVIASPSGDRSGPQNGLYNSRRQASRF